MFEQALDRSVTIDQAAEVFVGGRNRRGAVRAGRDQPHKLRIANVRTHRQPPMAIQHKTARGNSLSLSSLSNAWHRALSLSLLVLTFLLIPGKAVWSQSHARLSDKLQEHVASKSKASLDVIVRGTAEEIDAIAARQHLTIMKRLDNGAVFQANAAEIDALSSEPSIDHLSRDVQVTSFMAVTDPAIGADQVWAGGAAADGIE